VDAERFRDKLLAKPGMSRVNARKVLVSFKALLKNAVRLKHLKVNPAADTTITAQRRGRIVKGEKITKRKIAAGVDFPRPDEVKLILGHATGKARVILAVAAFAGLRASELRGLRWSDLHLGTKPARIEVNQRADRYKVLDAPKSETSERSIPIDPHTALALREWKKVCPASAQDLVFPTSKGTVENHSNLVQRVLQPVQIAAGMTVTRKNKKGRTITVAKYTGIHALRHFYASLCINPAPQGLGLPAKVVQTRLGHSTIMMTMDVYSHLFPNNDDGAELAAAVGKYFPLSVVA
jgi:integrase